RMVAPEAARAAKRASLLRARATINGTWLARDRAGNQVAGALAGAGGALSGSAGGTCRGTMMEGRAACIPACQTWIRTVATAAPIWEERAEKESTEAAGEAAMAVKAPNAAVLEQVAGAARALSRRTTPSFWTTASTMETGRRRVTQRTPTV